MSTKKILFWLLLLFGEAIIIAAFFLFRGNSPDNILVLNIVVSSLVYVLFFCDLSGAPWINLKDKTQKQVGALGISWLATVVYAIVSVGFMLIANLAYELAFATQLLVHCGLLFFLFLGLLFARHSAEKVAKVNHEQTSNRNGILEMKKAMIVLKDKISETTDLPNNIVQKVNSLEESLRFISPTENSEAHELENSFVKVIESIRFAIQDYSLNAEQIDNNLKKCERIYQNRKNIHSN